MGYGALPFIRQLYDRKSEDIALLTIQMHGLVSLVRDIVGEGFSIPSEIAGRTAAVGEYARRWLDENMKRFVR